MPVRAAKMRRILANASAMPQSKPRKHSAPPGRIRIVAGAWRGRRIDVPQTRDLRPTPDRVRETLFNWLGFIAGTLIACNKYFFVHKNI